MKSAQLVAQAVAYQLALLPKNTQQQYANLINATRAFPEMRIQWLLYLHSQLSQHFESGAALVFPPYLKNKKMLQPPPAKMQLQEALFNIKTVHLEMKDLYAAVGRSIAIQLAITILGKEKPCDIVYIDRQAYSEQVERQPEEDSREAFISELERQNADLRQQISQQQSVIAKEQSRIKEIEHIEELYRQLVKKHAADFSNPQEPLKSSFKGSQIVENDLVAQEATIGSLKSRLEAQEFEMAEEEACTEQFREEIETLQAQLQTLTTERDDWKEQANRLSEENACRTEATEDLKEALTSQGNQLQSEEAENEQLRELNADLEAKLAESLELAEEAAAAAPTIIENSGDQEPEAESENPVNTDEHDDQQPEKATDLDLKTQMEENVLQHTATTE